jgi:microsomal epoxide hydrolase
MLDAIVAQDAVDEVKQSNELNDFDREAIKRWEWFQKWEFAYKNEHATKSGTIGFALESSPIALLAW